MYFTAEDKEAKQRRSFTPIIKGEAEKLGCYSGFDWLKQEQTHAQGGLAGVYAAVLPSEKFATY